MAALTYSNNAELTLKQSISQEQGRETLTQHQGPPIPRSPSISLSTSFGTTTPDHELKEKPKKNVKVQKPFADLSRGNKVTRNDASDRQAASRLSTISTTSSVDTVVARLRSRKPRAPFSHPLSHVKTDASVIVDFDGEDDPYRPINWPFKKKVITTALYGFTTMASTWASAVYAPAIKPVAEEFGVSTEVSTLGISLFLLGLGIGPLLFAPLSEVYGRKVAVLTPMFLAMIFSFSTAVAKDIQTVLITRFFAGFFGAAPVSNVGGVLGDLYSPEVRAVALVGYALAVVGGPTIGPVAGGALTMEVNWRWTQYITGIMIALALAMDVIYIDETYAPVLLVYKSRRLRHSTGNWALHAYHEEWDVSVKELARKYLVRPFQMLFTPICCCMTVYTSFCFGIVYLNLASFPIEFEEQRGWNLIVGALPLLAVLVGMFAGAVVNILNQRFYYHRFVANNHRAVPEARLPPMMAGSILLSSGFFIFGWTSDKSIHWIAPVVAAGCMGFGFSTIFQTAVNYLVDTFTLYGASAIAANTFVRSIFAAAFPLFAPAMFHNLGIDWACSMFGFISFCMIPIPYLFYVFGRRIRARGKWSKASL